MRINVSIAERHIDELERRHPGTEWDKVDHLTLLSAAYNLACEEIALLQHCGFARRGHSNVPANVVPLADRMPKDASPKAL